MLRPYQIDSIERIREEFRKGKKKVLLHLATGGGKTVVFCDLIKSASKKGNKTLVVVRGRKLVDQASQRLVRENVEHGVLMARHWNYRPHLPNQVASIDTLISRKLKPEADIIIIDEAHLATSEGYVEFLKQYIDPYIVSVTATPYVDKSIRHIADTVIQPIAMQGLIDAGYLVPFRYFAPSEPNLDSVAISKSTHDYVNDQLEIAMVQGGLTGKVVEHWIKIAEQRPTICFAVNIHHSKILVQKFNEAGITCEHCDADTSDNERNEIIHRLEKGETKIVCNVGIFGTGIDIPCLGTIIMARPTKSKNLFIQQCGRGTRPFEGKSNCIILDHSGNILRHGFPTEEWEVNLDGKTSERTVKKSKICKQCFGVFRGSSCPICGTEQLDTKEEKTEIEESNDELKEIEPAKQKLMLAEKIAKQNGYKRGWAYHQLIKEIGWGKALPYLPNWFVNHYVRGNDPFAGSPFSACQIESETLKNSHG